MDKTHGWALAPAAPSAGNGNIPAASSREPFGKDQPSGPVTPAQALPSALLCGMGVN